ncbi:MAG: ATP-binding protein [Legionellales bacterium]|nr:ATP-binding protein [Legionellales bacterium]
MVASTGKELPTNVSPADSDAKLELVHTAVIYGANAAGKSNLIRALHFMREFILSSTKELQKGEDISVDSFLFDKEYLSKPSKFEVTFIKNKVRYQYGFELDKRHIHEEWLFAYPFGRMQQWFHRVYDKKKNSYLWKFSTLFTGQKQLWKDSTRDNALFLSTAVQLNSEQLASIFDWFQKDLVVLPAFNRINLSRSLAQLETHEGKKKLLKYINIADASISDILTVTEKFSSDKIPKDIPDNIKEKIKHDLSGKDILTKLEFIHPDNTSLDFEEESHGTQKFFGFAGYWVDALENKKVVVVDELDNSLHPLAVRFLINLISDPEVNQNKSQLIFTTHDTSLLDSNLFRRDQVWFVEKDQYNSTQLYPLLDFSPRKDEAIGRGYLQGRYGALPYIGNWSF